MPKELPALTPSDIARFWAKVATRHPSECWEWQGARLPRGYGVFKVRGRMVKAHRIAYLLATGEDPLDNFVCHHCDNPPCCNPSHVFSGTNADNQLDCAAKGRKNSAVGERVGGVRLTDDDVMTIRGLYERGEVMQEELAARYGVSRRTISSVVNGTNWKHLPVLHTRRRRVSRSRHRCAVP